MTTIHELNDVEPRQDDRQQTLDPDFNPAIGYLDAQPTPKGSHATKKRINRIITDYTANGNGKTITIIRDSLHSPKVYPYNTRRADQLSLLTPRGPQWTDAFYPNQIIVKRKKG